jgi:hypothetical protein
MAGESEGAANDADPARMRGSGLLDALADLDLGETMPADVFDPRWGGE